MRQEVLQLCLQGTPQAWISQEEAVLHYATGSVVWEAGDGPLATLRGGWNVPTRRASEIVIHPIIAVRGVAKRNLFDIAPRATKAKLIKRDRNMCAYCARVFRDQDLEAEHIVPQSRGGPYDWMNLVCACTRCNSFKGARLPSEAGMSLCYLPYVPSRHEDFLLRGRNVRADVHEWLTAKLPKGSRLI